MINYFLTTTKYILYVIFALYFIVINVELRSKLLYCTNGFLNGYHIDSNIIVAFIAIYTVYLQTLKEANDKHTLSIITIVMNIIVITTLSYLIFPRYDLCF